MSVDVLYEPRFGGLGPSVGHVTRWASRGSNAESQPVGATGWMEHLSRMLGGSFVTCCLALSWVEYRPTAKGVDVNLVFDPHLLPERLIVSPDEAESGARWLQRPVPGATYVFDEACTRHNLLEAIDLVGAFFVSPLDRDAVFHVLEVAPVTERSRRHGGFGDWLIELHGYSQRHKRGLTCRLTTHWTGEGTVHHLITNRLDLRSPVVFGIYKHRREIASFLEQVRHSRTRRFLLGSGRGLSPLRLFGSLLILRVWQQVAGWMRHGQQEVSRAMAELSHDALGRIPPNDMAHYPPGWHTMRPLTPRAEQKEGLTTSFLWSSQTLAEMQNWRTADAALTHG